MLFDTAVVMLNIAVADKCVGVLESITSTVMGYVLAAVGTPVNTPVEVMAIPGTLPLVIVHAYGGVPPVAANAVL